MNSNTNSSIYDAFNRMWLHILAKISKCMPTENPTGTGTLTIDSVRLGDATMSYDSTNKRIIINMQDSAQNNYENTINLISFSMDGTQYSAVYGMTWDAWVNSTYNTGGYYISYNSVQSSFGIVESSGVRVAPTDVINDGGTYKSTNSKPNPEDEEE